MLCGFLGCDALPFNPVLVHLPRRLVGWSAGTSPRSPPGKKGWLAGLNDPTVGRALALLHERPKDHWTVEELAKRVGVSRSLLAGIFTELVGQSPMAYLARWRMQLASTLLAESRAKVSAIAGEVGYDSEAAFSRAFKSCVGVPPAVWRSRHTRSV